MRSSISCTPPPLAIDTPARLHLPLPSLLRCYLHTHDTFQAINQASSRARETEGEGEQAKTKQKISINRSRNIFAINICVGETVLGRSRGRDISRAYRITARIREAEGESERDREERGEKRHKRTLNLP